jgi:hypothetical protein
MFATLLHTFASLVPIPIGGVCVALLLTLSFAIVGGTVDDLDNPLCLHEMKLGELSRTILFGSGYNK